LETTVNLLAVDLSDTRWCKCLIDHLKSFDQQSVTSALTSRLSNDLNSYGAAHIAEAMGELNWPAFTEPLIAAMGEDQDDFLCETAIKSLIEIGRSAQAALIEQWDQLDRSQQIFGQSVIGSVHGEATADFAVARFSKLMAEDVEYACELILASPNLELLNLLKPELRRKQPSIDRAFYICARLLDYDGPEIRDAKERALAEFERCENLFESIGTGGISKQEQLFVELECPLCKAVNRYKAKGVIVSDDPDARFLLNDEFPCASCGEYVEFRFTPMASMALSVGFLGSQVNAKEGRQQNDQFKSINYKVDGRVMPLAIGLSKIREHLAANQKNGLDWYRLGNLLSFLNRPKETIAAYRNVLNIEPNAVDATFALATILAECRQEAEALALLQKSLEQISNWIFLFPFPNFNREFADLYNHLCRLLGKGELPALHPSALVSPKKIGRNDSCPCGSGKKFKKCCGR
jgi:tetratricopeptide (TPR) repeat protein